MIVAAGYRWTAGAQPGLVIGTTRHGAQGVYYATTETYRSTDALCRAIVQATDYFWPRVVNFPTQETRTP